MRWYDLPGLLPDIYRHIKSMFEVAKVENIELLQLKSVLQHLWDNFYIQTCDVQTLEYWENIIGIELYGDETIEQRRQMVLLYLQNNWQITKPYVESVMINMFGEGHYSFEYSDESNLIVIIKFIDVLSETQKRFLDWFSTVCPAHIRWHNYHTENTQADNLISANTESHSTAIATSSLQIGTGVIYLGNTEITTDWIEV